MTGPAVVSVARIEPDLARRSWARVRRLVARDDPGGASDDLRCFIAVFGHGDGVPETIERVRGYSRPVRQTPCVRTSPFRPLSRASPVPTRPARCT